ncbi:MAG: NFACT family protein [Akkermansiaceae bacterium]|nr:NFACT family protein [Armatimonadota bacterium]
MQTEVIPFDTFTFAAVAAELNRTLDGARIQKLRQTSSVEFGIALYGASGGANNLLITADPRLFRVHLTQVRREPLPTAPGFLQVARKWLDGAYFVAATLPTWDRVLRLSFQTPEKESVHLLCELMGRNANVVLTTGGGGAETVRGVLRNPTGGERILRPNVSYTVPPGTGDKPDPRTARAENFPEEPDAVARFLSMNYSGMSRLAATEVVARAAHEGKGYAAALESLLAEVDAKRFDPHQIGDGSGATIGVWAFLPRSVPSGLRFQRESISVALDTFYAALGERTTEAGERSALAKAIEKETAYRTRELSSQRKTLAEADRADEYEQWGNLILASPNDVPDSGATSVVLADLYAETEGETVTIPLDPKRTARENADALFARARKSRDAAEYADGQVADLEDELERLAALAVRLSTTTAEEDLPALREELEEIVGEERVGGGNKPRDKKPAPKPFDGHKIRTYDVDGFTFYVGETADANDHLLTRVASPTDIWMHVRAATGAHGVLRTNKEPQRVPDTVIRKAAAIVAAKSQSVKHSSIVAVDITERRYVRKPRGAKAGLAQYSQARTVDVTPKLP